MTPAEQMREAAAQVAENVRYAPECCRDHSIAIAAAIRALPLPVDVNETPLCEHQTGLMLTDAPQRPADPVMDEVGTILCEIRHAAERLTGHGRDVGWAEVTAFFETYFHDDDSPFNEALALIKGRG